MTTPLAFWYHIQDGLKDQTFQLLRTVTPINDLSEYLMNACNRSKALDVSKLFSQYFTALNTMFLYQDKKERETNGFKSRMGQNAPRPRLLRLKLEDNAKTKNANLTKGHFTWITEQGRQERWIVASCGNYTVLWNFRSGAQVLSAILSWCQREGIQLIGFEALCIHFWNRDCGPSHLLLIPLLLVVQRLWKDNYASLKVQFRCEIFTCTLDSTLHHPMCLGEKSNPSMAKDHRIQVRPCWTRQCSATPTHCRAVKVAKPDNISYGGLTTVNDYHLIPKNESVVDSVFMHDNFASTPTGDESAMVVVTDDHVYSLMDEDWKGSRIWVCWTRNFTPTQDCFSWSVFVLKWNKVAYLNKLSRNKEGILIRILRIFMRSWLWECSPPPWNGTKCACMRASFCNA